MNPTHMAPPPAKDDALEGAGVDESQPWISYSEPKPKDATPESRASSKSSILPFALGGALGVAALAASAYLVVRPRRKSLTDRMVDLLTSPAAKTVATSLGSAAVAGGISVLKDTLSKYASTRHRPRPVGTRESAFHARARA